MRIVLKAFTIVLIGFSVAVYGQNFDTATGDSKLQKAKAIIAKSAAKLGGKEYLSVKTSIGEGKFSQLKDGVNVSFQSFIDIIVFPDFERTDLTEGGSKTVQVNTGETGWIYEEYFESLRDQDEKGITGFRNSMRSNYDYLLRKDWSREAVLSYVGRRRASLGKRNDVLKLTFADGFEVEYEFADDGLPMKTIFRQFDTDKKEIVQETRFAQFLFEQGVLTPYIIDRYTDGVHVYRINYESVKYNQTIPSEIFKKPDDPKKLRKKLKL